MILVQPDHYWRKNSSTLTVFVDELQFLHGTDRVKLVTFRCANGQWAVTTPTKFILCKSYPLVLHTCTKNPNVILEQSYVPSWLNPTNRTASFDSLAPASSLWLILSVSAYTFNTRKHKDDWRRLCAALPILWKWPRNDSNHEFRGGRVPRKSF